MLLTDLVLIGSLGNVTIPFVDLKLKLGRRWLLNWIWNKSKISDSKFRDLTPKQHRFGLDAAQFIFRSNVTHFLISVALFFQELAIQELFLASRQKSNLWLWSSRMVLDFYRYLTQEDTSSWHCAFLFMPQQTSKVSLNGQPPDTATLTRGSFFSHPLKMQGSTFHHSQKGLDCTSPRGRHRQALGN